MAEQQAQAAQRPDTGTTHTTDEFVQASCSLTKEGAKRMTQESNRHLFKSEAREAKVVKENTAGKACKWENLAEDWLQEKLNSKGGVRFGELGFADVRGANLAGLEIEVKRDGTTMRLEDFLLSANKAQIEAVMPKMVWQYQDTSSVRATVFSANKTINDKIRERLVSGCKEYDGYAINERNNLKDCNAARSEVLLLDRWDPSANNQNRSDGKKIGTLTHYQYDAKKALEAEYLEKNYEKVLRETIQKNLERGMAVRAFDNVDEWIKLKNFVNDEYQKRGFEIVKDLQAQDKFVETETYMQLRNSVKAQITPQLAEPKVRENPVENASVVDPVVAPDAVVMSRDISSTVNGNWRDIADRLNALPESTDEFIKAAHNEIEEFLYRATNLEESLKQRGLARKEALIAAPNLGEEEQRADELLEVVKTLDCSKNILVGLEDKVQKGQLEGDENYKELVRMSRERFDELLDGDNKDKELRETEQKLRDAAMWSSEGIQLIQEGEELNQRYKEMVEGRSLLSSDEVVELLKNKQENLNGVRRLLNFGMLDDQGEGLILIEENFRRERIEKLESLSNELNGWDDQRLVSGRSQVQPVEPAKDQSCTTDEEANLNVNMNPPRRKVNENLGSSGDLTDPESESGKVSTNNYTVRVISDDIEERMNEMPEGFAGLPPNLVSCYAEVDGQSGRMYAFRMTGQEAWCVSWKDSTETIQTRIVVFDSNFYDESEIQEFDLLKELECDSGLYVHLQNPEEEMYSYIRIFDLNGNPINT